MYKVCLPVCYKDSQPPEELEYHWNEHRWQCWWAVKASWSVRSCCSQSGVQCVPLLCTLPGTGTHLQHTSYLFTSTTLYKLWSHRKAIESFRIIPFLLHIFFSTWGKWRRGIRMSMAHSCSCTRSSLSFLTEGDRHFCSMLSLNSASNLQCNVL